MFEILAVVIGLELQYNQGEYATKEECIADIPFQAELLAAEYQTEIRQSKYYKKHETYLYRFVYEGQVFTVKASCREKPMEESNEETTSDPVTE